MSAEVTTLMKKTYVSPEKNVMIRLERANPGANLECFQFFGYANVSFV